MKSNRNRFNQRQRRRPMATKLSHEQLERRTMLSADYGWAATIGGSGSDVARPSPPTNLATHTPRVTSPARSILTQGLEYLT